jgi:hypothetical protein
MRCGKGVFTYPKGFKYEGDWLDDMQHGEGFETYVSNANYRG